MNRKILSVVIVVSLVLIILAGCGGSPARIEGTVTLQNGAAQPIADVEVNLLFDVSGTGELEAVATTTTDSAGNYSFADVEPGEYTMTALASGLCLVVIPPFKVGSGDVVQKNIRLAYEE